MQNCLSIEFFEYIEKRYFKNIWGFFAFLICFFNILQIQVNIVEAKKILKVYSRCLAVIILMRITEVPKCIKIGLLFAEWIPRTCRF